MAVLSSEESLEGGEGLELLDGSHKKLRLWPFQLLPFRNASSAERRFVKDMRAEVFDADESSPTFWDSESTRSTVERSPYVEKCSFKTAT